MNYRHSEERKQRLTSLVVLRDSALKVVKELSLR